MAYDDRDQHSILADEFDTALTPGDKLRLAQTIKVEREVEKIELELAKTKGDLVDVAEAHKLVVSLCRILSEGIDAVVEMVDEIGQLAPEQYARIVQRADGIRTTLVNTIEKGFGGDDESSEKF